MSETEVADVFGIELAPASVVSAPAATPIPAPTPPRKRKPPVKSKARQRSSPTIRARLVAAQKARWVKMLRMGKKKAAKK
jgi:hypothetical protein